ncbi:MAG: RNA polymerase sigma-70 factor [Pseudosphingobacterium sp.]|nr:RNA polymerase sigma-70 factor [Olivibacter sp. UJ_SKK_5.1]MDX3915514.1 RNA polymerase sigma-70 factor [Pseudosphingobacterium sp.]
MSGKRDRALLQRFIAGDDSAFAELYDAYWERLFLCAVRILDNEDDAEDAVQDTFVSCWKYRKSIEHVENIQSYLLAIVRNNAVKIIRRNIETRHYLSSIKSFFDELAGASDEAFMAKGLEQFFESEIEKLPTKMREIFLLSRKEELSHKQIAERLGISNETVKKQIYNSLKTLREKLNKDQCNALILLVMIKFYCL